MAVKDLGLALSQAKIPTMKRARGLEFPIVALAEFPQRDYPPTPKHLREASTRSAALCTST